MPYIDLQNKLLWMYLTCLGAELYRFFMLQTRKIILYSFGSNWAAVVVVAFYSYLIRRKSIYFCLKFRLGKPLHQLSRI